MFWKRCRKPGIRPEPTQAILVLEWYMLEKSIGEEGLGPVQARRLFQYRVLYWTPSHRCRWHGNGMFSKSLGAAPAIENSGIQFRAEFYNALNHTQFANPDTNFK